MFRLRPAARGLHTAAFRPAFAPSPSPVAKYANFANARGIASTAPAKVNASAPVKDGGQEEAPHHGINVDTPVRMDT